MQCPSPQGQPWAVAGLIVLLLMTGRYYHICAQKPEMPRSLSLLIEHVQTMSIMSAAAVPWSCQTTAIFNSASAGDMSVSQMMKLACIVPQMDYYAWFILTLISPLIVFVLLFLMNLVVRWLDSKREIPMFKSTDDCAFFTRDTRTDEPGKCYVSNSFAGHMKPIVLMQDGQTCLVLPTRTLAGFRVKNIGRGKPGMVTLHSGHSFETPVLHQKEAFKLWEEAVQLLLLCIFVQHSAVSKSTLAFFATQTINNQTVIQSDMQVSVSDELYMSFYPVAVFALILCVSLPVLLAMLIGYWRFFADESKLRRGGMWYRLAGTYYAKYRFQSGQRGCLGYGSIFYESIRIMRKLLLIVVRITVEEPSAQRAIILMVMIVSLALVAYFKPYKRSLSSLNWIEAASVFAILFSTLLSIIEDARVKLESSIAPSTNSTESDMRCTWNTVQGETIGIILINTAVVGLCLLSMSGFFNDYNSVHSRWKKVQWATRAFKGSPSASTRASDAADASGVAAGVEMVRFPGVGLLAKLSRGGVASTGSDKETQDSVLWQQLLRHTDRLLRCNVNIDHAADQPLTREHHVQKVWAVLRHESGMVETLKKMRDLADELLAAGAELEGDDSDDDEHSKYVKHVSSIYQFNDFGPSRHASGPDLGTILELGQAPELDVEPSDLALSSQPRFKRAETADGSVYYIDMETEEAVWDLPEGAIVVNDEEEISVESLPSELPVKSAGWRKVAAIRHVDMKAARFGPVRAKYSICEQTNADVGQAPDVEPPPSDLAVSSQQRFKYAETADGDVFYVDIETEEAMWDLPDGSIVVNDEEEDSVEPLPSEVPVTQSVSVQYKSTSWNKVSAIRHVDMKAARFGPVRVKS
jgi:hypothetical protein